MSYFNLKELNKYDYRHSKSCENCSYGKIRLGISNIHVNWCEKIESQINHIFVCNQYKKN